MIFKDVKMMMKLYPVRRMQSSRKKWIEKQEVKRISLKLIDELEEGTANKVFDHLNTMGYGMGDSRTYFKEVSISNLAREQAVLKKMFDLTVYVN